MSPLTYRQASPDGYRIRFDGVEIGSVSKRMSHTDNREHWHWGVDTMPLMERGGHPPSGDAWSFAEALEAFKGAFLQWQAEIDPATWQRNRDHIAHCQARLEALRR